MKEIKLKNSIMRRVYAIWAVRFVLPKVAFISVLGFVTYRVVAETFFVAQVVANFLAVASSNFMELPRFIASALNSAESAVLLFISIAGILGFLSAIKLWRSLRVLLKQGYFSSNFSYSKRELG